LTSSVLVIQLLGRHHADGASFHGFELEQLFGSRRCAGSDLIRPVRLMTS
jgi:hypothetical protein